MVFIFIIFKCTICECGINYCDRQYNININKKVLHIAIKSFITFYEDLKIYAGIRHKFNYPTKGQRTRTNAKTRRKISKKKTLLLKLNHRKSF